MPVIEWEPTLKVEIVNCANPDWSGTVLSSVVPSRNSTRPVGAAPNDFTVAEIVTFCPKLDGFGLEVTVIVVANLATLWVSTADPLLAKTASPLYVAVIARKPGPREEVLERAVFPVRLPVPISSPLSRNVTALVQTDP